MVCDTCGEHFFKHQAAAEYEGYFGGDASYYLDVRGCQCGRCAILQFISSDEYDEYCCEDDEDGEYERAGFEGRNPMCLACGNPDFPMCMDSCSRIDD